mgnify:CR=1 FL=1
MSLNAPEFIDKSIKQWSHLVEGSPHQIIVYYDYKNLTYFQNARAFSPRKLIGHNFWHVWISLSHIAEEYNKERQKLYHNNFIWHQDHESPHFIIESRLWEKYFSIIVRKAEGKSK